MKNLISKAALLFLGTAIALSSCSKDNGDGPKTVTLKYRILVNSALDYAAGSENGGITQLHDYTNSEMRIVSEQYDKAPWTITQTAATEEAAIAACDKKAIAVFDAKLSDINAAVASVKTKFDAKKAALQSAIADEPKTARVIYKDYGGTLFKGNKDALSLGEIIKTGNLIELKAVGEK